MGPSVAGARWVFFRAPITMSGGLYPGRPFAFNLKCIVFTAAVAGGYWWLPPRSWWVLLMLLWLPYVAMAWYDYMYDCRDKMGPTLVPFGRWLFLPLNQMQTNPCTLATRGRPPAGC